MRRSIKNTIAVVVATITVCALPMGAIAATSGNTTSGNTTPEVATKTEAPATTEASVVVEVVEPTAATIDNPGSAATYQQAMSSTVVNVNRVAAQIAEGKAPEGTVATVNLGNYHSVSAKSMTEIEKANVDVQLTYRYMGRVFTVKIPKGYKFDKNIPWYGPLYMYMLFGQSIE